MASVTSHYDLRAQSMEEVIESKKELLKEEGPASAATGEGSAEGKPVKFGHIRFGKLANDLVLSVPTDRILSLCFAVENATGETLGKGAKKVPFLVRDVLL